MIHVCFGLHDADGKYSKFVGTTMASIFENTSSPVTSHIFHDNTLTAANREKFFLLASKYNQHVEFHNAETLCPDEVNFLKKKISSVFGTRFSIGTFYRLLIKKILSAQGISKVIYLDADIIVNLDLAELWQQDLKNYPVAAVPEVEATLNLMIKNKFVLHKRLVKMDNYFCAGVMILNLDKIGESFFTESVSWLAEHPQCECFDQDILNVFFSENYFKLLPKFDSFVNPNRDWKLPVAEKIYHYAGCCIGLNLKDVYNRLFLENFARTPWFNVEVIGKIAESLYMEKCLNLLRIQYMMKICPQHRRAFFLYPHDLPTIKEVFNIQDDEPIIEAKTANSADELLAEMKNLRGQKVFIIFQSDWTSIKKMLEDNGFEETKDFVNGMVFMVEDQERDKLFEYNFIRSM